MQDLRSKSTVASARDASASGVEAGVDGGAELGAWEDDGPLDDDGGEGGAGEGEGPPRDYNDIWAMEVPY